MSPDPIPPRRVLVIAYYFPPMGLSGVQRTLKFVKYLTRFGWHPTVLTVQPGGYFARDETLLAELEGRNVRIERTSPSGPLRLFRRKPVVGMPKEWKRRLFSRLSDTFFIPDNKIGWKRRAVARALALHRETPFDLVFATAPPFTAFLIGRRIKKKINKPLVLDYRDPWVDYPFKFYPTPLHKLANVLLERRALRASSHVITTNRRVKEQILQRHRFLTYHDIDIISQGFDPEDFPGAPHVAARKPRTPPAERRMRVTYAGVFWEDRVPDFFLRALHELFAEKPRLRGRIEALFVGKFREENMRLVARLSLQDTVRVVDYLPHRECVAELRASDVLWMTVGDGVGSPGKVYEYIGARKPILALVPDGYLKATVEEAGGIAVGPRDVPAIKGALEELLALHEKRQLKGPRPEVVEKYDRVALTGALVKLFESLFEP
ncbi:MAG TPA: glycosyltransferase family 4 protein [Bacteroidota bacterium]|nr:glycosyltransferase family 4 protein [Bacteroidota bacterium]